MECRELSDKVTETFMLYEGEEYGPEVNPRIHRLQGI